MSLLVVGATGTLGRQIVKTALDNGYDVTCLTRNFRRSAFLKYWGANLVYGDLSVPETIPLTLKGIRVVIDASTVRPSDQYSTETVDWIGKIALFEAAKLAKIESFSFFSFLGVEKESTVPVLQLKSRFKQKLATAKFRSTIYNSVGFFQGLIEQYAIPLLEGQAIWQVDSAASLAYIDSQDAAELVIAELNSNAKGQRIRPLVGSRSWTSLELIGLCERLSGKKAKVYKLPGFVIAGLGKILRFLEATWNIADRLDFYDVLQGTFDPYDATNDEGRLEELGSLEEYFQDYFAIMRFESSYTPFSETPKG